ncbi:MAG: hypothetical protein GX605_02565, partial [Chloroflexi bacterium]|nr:hypothetical protein [Chloroflexota bacterium]
MTLTAPAYLEEAPPLAGEMPDAPMLAAALAYAARGWAVFPCKPRGKEPLTPHGCKDATTDAARVRAWWAKWPRANVGIACGPSGLVVLDVDGDAGRASWAQLGQSGQTPTATTGKGQHLYYQANGHHVGNSAGKLGPGLDVRGAGGYVVAPPSVHPSGAVYAWADFLSPDDVPLAPFPDALAERLGGGLRIAQTPGPAEPLPERIGEGQRNALLASLAGSMRRRGASQASIEAALLEENAARCAPPLTDAEVRQIAGSVARYTPAPQTDAPATLTGWQTLADVGRYFG